MNDYSFTEEETIQAPDELNTPSDLEQLFLHVISRFYKEIDAYGSNKTQLLSSIKSILTEYIPRLMPTAVIKHSCSHQ